VKTKKLKNIFLSSIYQDAGKTTISLGLYKAFKDRKLRTAFMKPVGQRYVNVGEHNVDKDSYLMGEVYHCGKDYKAMSPVTVGRGFTEKYIFNPQKDKLLNSIKSAFASLKKRKDAFIVEGTGHAGVGSVIDFSNADVAKLLGSKVIIVSEGGIGKSIDEIMLNKALFDLLEVETLGVIVNKVLPSKYEKIKRTVERGLKNKGIRLLGVIPAQSHLSFANRAQVQERLRLELICGKKNISRRVKSTIVAAMEPHNMISYLKPGTLVLTSGDRVDNILLAVSSQLMGEGTGEYVSGIILTGGLMPNREIVDLIKKSQMPVFITDDDTYTVAAKYEHLTCKIEKTDKDKILEAARLVKKYVDIPAILNGF